MHSNKNSATKKEQIEKRKKLLYNEKKSILERGNEMKREF